MDNFGPYNGKAPSNGSGSQGDGGSQGGGPGLPNQGLSMAPPNGQGGGDAPAGFPTGDAARQTLWYVCYYPTSVLSIRAIPGAGLAEATKRRAFLSVCSLAWVRADKILGWVSWQAGWTRVSFVPSSPLP